MNIIFSNPVQVAPQHIDDANIKIINQIDLSHSSIGPLESMPFPFSFLKTAHYSKARGKRSDKGNRRELKYFFILSDKNEPLVIVTLYRDLGSESNFFKFSDGGFSFDLTYVRYDVSDKFVRDSMEKCYNIILDQRLMDLFDNVRILAGRHKEITKTYFNNPDWIVNKIHRLRIIDNSLAQPLTDTQIPKKFLPKSMSYYFRGILPTYIIKRVDGFGLELQNAFAWDNGILKDKERFDETINSLNSKHKIPVILTQF